MRFIGNKEKLLESIYEVTLSTGIQSGKFCDFFSGTSNVGRFFKEKGFEIVSSDLLYFSYVLQKAYVENNSEPDFKKLLKITGTSKKSLFASPFDSVREHLNSIKGVKGFIYKNYTDEGTKNSDFSRKYFTPENGKRIDAIRGTIEEWKNSKLINENEYFVLLAALIESVPFYANISGVYAAFLKNYDPRALKPLEIKSINFYPSKKKHIVYNKDSMDIIDKIDVDILYMDPPYNQRQYAPNYHLLETIAMYDNPQIKGVTGMRDYQNKKSVFCNKDTALNALDMVAKKAKYKKLILSYNSEGIMPEKDIISVLSRYGKVDLKNIDYLRFKSNSNGESKTKKIIQEQLYVLNR
ncbi:MAG: DNA adenine methylase [Candidatus Parcubacteria bacterium]|nr:DNA adenine methylase [Candidatus Parcubacteria bacterium]